jgi:CMP-N-acetylneuraminic acid synthetase
MAPLKTLGLIPARAGSKGVAGKNTRLLHGKPLVQYTAEAALAARRLSRVVLSTEDETIAAIGRACGVAVPFIRPAELARDDTPMLPVIQHAVRALEAEGDRFDAVCLLQPTNPLRRAEDIDACIGDLEQSDADSIVTILPVPTEHNPYWVYFRDPSGLMRLSTGGMEPLPRRQDLPAAFHREGSIYVTRRTVLMVQNSLYGQRLVGYPIAPERALNIDTPQDWSRAERMLETAHLRAAAAAAATA